MGIYSPGVRWESVDGRSWNKGRILAKLSSQDFMASQGDQTSLGGLWRMGTSIRIDQLWKMRHSGQTDLAGCLLKLDKYRKNMKVQKSRPS